jgi:hypothetical protein
VSGSGSDLRALLAGPPIVVAPGIYDALSALLANQAGFEALYLSGASIAYTRFGRPDLGLVGMDEVAETLMAIRERVSAPIVVDADTGFGNALNVQRTVSASRAPAPMRSRSRIRPSPSAAAISTRSASCLRRRWSARSRPRSTRDPRPTC